MSAVVGMPEDYRVFLEGRQGEKFRERFAELQDTANEFIEKSGYSEYVTCNERILMSVLLDYYTDISRLKDFHGIELVRTEKITAYTVAWIIKRKPLQFVEYPENERDIFVNERFAAFLVLNECFQDDTQPYISENNQQRVDEYMNLLLYYLKYRSCNPQAIELAIESYKVGFALGKSVTSS